MLRISRLRGAVANSLRDLKLSKLGIADRGDRSRTYSCNNTELAAAYAILGLHDSVLTDCTRDNVHGKDHK